MQAQPFRTYLRARNAFWIHLGRLSDDVIDIDETLDIPRVTKLPAAS